MIADAATFSIPLSARASRPQSLSAYARFIPFSLCDKCISGAGVMAPHHRGRSASVVSQNCRTLWYRVPRLRRSATVPPFDAEHGCGQRSRGTRHH
jgi:hypothetical protein